MSCVPFPDNNVCPVRGTNKNNFANKMECQTICKDLLVQCTCKQKQKERGLYNR